MTIHRGTVQGGYETRIGDDNLFMAYVHIAHDCVIGNHVVFSNNACVAGHVHVGDWTTFAGFALSHQFVHIGPHCFIAAAGFCYHDVPAFVTASGNPAEPRTINREGMKRRGFSPDEIALANKAYKLLFRRGLNIDDAIKAISELGDNRVVAMVLGSVENSTRGIIR